METNQSKTAFKGFLMTVAGLVFSGDVFASAPICAAGLGDVAKAANVAVATAAGASTRKPTSTRGMSSLEKAARYHSTRCRGAARFLGGGVRCGNRSKGMCNAATREIIRDGFGINIPSTNLYRDKKRLYDNSKNLTKLNVSSCDQAPPGAVCLYSTSRHAYGHTEVKTGIGYCSDFCSWRPASSGRGKFKFQGAYMPKK